MPVKHNEISFIDPLRDTSRFRRSIGKRGHGLYKKAMELAILTGAKVLLSIELFDHKAARKTAVTFTSREDRDWQKHAKKLSKRELDDDNGTIRLDFGVDDYTPICAPDDPPVKVEHSRGIKQPWHWTPTTAHILLPQLLGDEAETSRKLENCLEIVRPELDAYFGTDPEVLEDSRVEECPSNEEEAEISAVDHDDDYFSPRPVRPNWIDAQETQRRVRQQSQCLMNHVRQQQQTNAHFFCH